MNKPDTKNNNMTGCSNFVYGFFVACIKMMLQQIFTLFQHLFYFILHVWIALVMPVLTVL